MINEYDRPVKGYKTSEQYDHPATVLYDNFAPKVEEEVISLDETRLWNELYTKKEYKNKNYYFLEKDLFQFRPNHRWYDAYLKLWEILYEK